MFELQKLKNSRPTVLDLPLGLKSPHTVDSPLDLEKPINPKIITMQFWKDWASHKPVSRQVWSSPSPFILPGYYIDTISQCSGLSFFDPIVAAVIIVDAVAAATSSDWHGDRCKLLYNDILHQSQSPLVLDFRHNSLFLLIGEFSPLILRETNDKYC